MWKAEWLFGRKVGELSFTIEGVPAYLRRAQPDIRYIYTGGKRKAVAYMRDHEENRLAKEFIRNSVLEHIQESRALGKSTASLPYPLTKDHFYFRTRTYSYYDSNPKDPKVSAPDIDNIQKMLYDALNELIWDDDSAIVGAVQEKGPGTPPRQEVVVEVWLTPKGVRKYEGS